MYAIMGATGNVGGGIAEKLLAEGKNIRAIGRSTEKLQPLIGKGAEVAAGDVTDAAFLKKAFDGAEAVFFMIPPNFQADNFRVYQNGIIDNAIAAVKETGVKYVVALSSQGAHLSEGNGPVAGLHDMEQKFAGLKDVNTLYLRPTFFMENTFMYIDAIKGMNLIGSNLKPDAKLPMIASRDIAKAGADALLSLDLTGNSVKDLLGHRDLTMTETTKILGEAIGKPDLPYVELGFGDVKNALLGIGFQTDSPR